MDTEQHENDSKPKPPPNEVPKPVEEKKVAEQEEAESYKEKRNSCNEHIGRIGPRGFWFQKNWLNEAKIQLVLIVFNFLTLVVAVFLFLTTQEQVELSRESFEIDSRPYIMLKQAEMQVFTPGKPMTAKVTFINTGKTPAIRSIFTVKWTSTLSPKFPIDSTVGLKTDSLSGVVILGPGQENWCTTDPTDTINALKDISYYQITNHLEFLYLFGIVEYDDIFGGHSTLTFGNRYRGTGSDFQVAETFNTYTYKKRNEIK